MTEPTQPETITFEYLEKGLDTDFYKNSKETMYSIVLCHDGNTYLAYIDIKLARLIPPSSILKTVAFT